jgi:hypothetical protein
MSAETGWATALGIAIGMLAWVVGFGEVLWPAHPQWAIFFITLGITIVSIAIFERIERDRLKGRIEGSGSESGV